MQTQSVSNDEWIFAALAVGCALVRSYLTLSTEQSTCVCDRVAVTHGCTTTTHRGTGVSRLTDALRLTGVTLQINGLLEQQSVCTVAPGTGHRGQPGASLQHDVVVLVPGALIDRCRRPRTMFHCWLMIMMRMMVVRKKNNMDPFVP